MDSGDRKPELRSFRVDSPGRDRTEWAPNGWSRLHPYLAGRNVAGMPHDSGKTWTADEIRALGVRTDLVTACSIIYGVGKTQAWERFHRGQLDFPAIRSGRGVVVPVAPLLKLMMIEEPAKPAPRRVKRQTNAA